jgi:hypothetical protein
MKKDHTTGAIHIWIFEQNLFGCFSELTYSKISPLSAVDAGKKIRQIPASGAQRTVIVMIFNYSAIF